MHPVQPLRCRLLPRGDSPNTAQRGRGRRCAAGISHQTGQRFSESTVSSLYFWNGLHRLRRLCQDMPGSGAGDEAVRADAGGAEPGVELYAGTCNGEGDFRGAEGNGQRQPVPQALCGVFRRVCRLRRDSIYQAYYPALRRPHAHRQLRRLHTHLGRISGDSFLHQ